MDAELGSLLIKLNWITDWLQQTIYRLLVNNLGLIDHLKPRELVESIACHAISTAIFVELV